MNINLKVITLLLSILLLSSCSIPRIFQVVISQGNLVDQEMLDKLEIGMTESQVKFVMGTPLISDTFYPNRWDYFTSVTQGENSYTNQKITLYFKDNKLVSWEGEIDTPN
ncbi:MAG: outer membrane protein assembly factor BamE [Gammaproteobacteria bacterium]|jgi:outer membrane protein assembly factor BamE|tara:strand:- start:2385 stop:2714 length:330 start_codon:yes stop_codon:yes gene_type:complete